MASARLTDEEYRFVYSRAPRLCVDLAIGSVEGLLLTKRDIPPAEGLWHMPGGRVFYKESLAEAAARIAGTELGITIELGDFIGYIEFLNDGEFVHTVSLVFCARQIGGMLRGSAQAKAVRMFKEPPADTHPEHKKFLGQNWDVIRTKCRGFDGKH